MWNNNNNNNININNNNNMNSGARLQGFILLFAFVFLAPPKKEFPSKKRGGLVTDSGVNKILEDVSKDVKGWRMFSKLIWLKVMLVFYGLFFYLKLTAHTRPKGTKILFQSFPINFQGRCVLVSGRVEFIQLTPDSRRPKAVVSENIMIIRQRSCFRNTKTT